MEEAIIDTENKVFWKVLYCLLHSVFCALKALQYCDSDKLSMDKNIFLVKHVNIALLKSWVLLNDEDLFGPMKGVAVVECKDELAEVVGESYTERSDELLRYFKKVNICIYSHFCFSSDDEDDNETTFGNAVCFAWFKRKECLEHACAVTAWTLSLHPEIHVDCAKKLVLTKSPQIFLRMQTLRCPCPWHFEDMS